MKAGQPRPEQPKANRRPEVPKAATPPAPKPRPEIPKAEKKKADQT
jgi:hypothetical protein